MPKTIAHQTKIGRNGQKVGVHNRSDLEAKSMIKTAAHSEAALVLQALYKSFQALCHFFH